MAAHRIPDDGQPQPGPSGGSGPGLVHPVEAVKYLGQVLLGYPDPGVPHLQQHLVAVPVHRDKDFTSGIVVFDGVFHQIKTNLRQIVLGAQREAVRFQILLQRHAGGIGHRLEQGRRPLRHLGHIHRVVLPLRQAVQPGEGQQMLSDPGQPLSFGADIGDKIPHHGRVHLFRLQDGVGQQADGGQRGFQLMAGVGDEAPPHLLGGLEPVGEVVELPGQLGHLVPPHRLEPVAVLPLPHDPDGPQQRGDPGSEHLGKQGAHHKGHHRDDHRDGAQILLQAVQQLPLDLVDLQDVDGPDHHPPVDDGHSGGGDEGPV